ncbi:leucine repeat adapter protein 25-like [Culicoides brevitarsis]|uniref:leucine repeat adapter protein 25-like n=1 Tax=Culicoides brevitarsis TaxID=469753 RepID=UPI00307CC028
MSLSGLPPLPKSLSELEVAQAQANKLNASISAIEQQQRLSQMQQRPPSTLDIQLAILRREMYSLRQLDLSLLSQLWTVNESIQEVRTLIQEQEAMSPPSPTPSNSESDLPSSEEESSGPPPSRSMFQSALPQQQQLQK